MRPAQVVDEESTIPSQKAQQTADTQAHYNMKHFAQPNPSACVTRFQGDSSREESNNALKK